MITQNKLEFSNHAKKRMKERSLTHSDIREAVTYGEKLKAKTKHTFEVRYKHFVVIVAEHDEKTVVVTAKYNKKFTRYAEKYGRKKGFGFFKALRVLRKMEKQEQIAG